MVGYDYLSLQPAHAYTAKPCYTCAHCETPGECPEVSAGRLAPGWPKALGRLEPQFLGIGKRCPLWTEKPQSEE